MAEEGVWLITGAARGIGYALAQEVLASGGSVVAAVHKQPDEALFRDGGDRCVAVTLDVSGHDESAYQAVVEKALERSGRIDVLVNNAGIGAITNFEETSMEEIGRLFEVNVFGLMRMTRSVLPVMREQQHGLIVNIASAAGYGAGPVPYHATKAAVTGFSMSLAF